MNEKYRALNDNAKERMLSDLKLITNDKRVLERCKQEIEILYDRGQLFLIQYLFLYREIFSKVNYRFNGFENNLLVLYVLGMSKVNPLEYNLPYEVFEESHDLTLYVEFINEIPDNFVNECNTVFCDSFILIKGRFEKEKDEALNELLSNHYIVIPKSDYKKIGNISDYRDVEDEYLTIKLTHKQPIHSEHVSIINAFKTDFEKHIADIIEPKDFDDYLKIISMGYGRNVWNDNQDEMFINNQIDVKNIISSREDVYNYLVEHGISKKISLEIMNYVRKGRGCPDCTRFSNEWNSYKKIMKKHNCEDWFIEVCSKIKYLYGKGRAIGECLYVLDESNYNNCDIISIVKE